MKRIWYRCTSFVHLFVVIFIAHTELNLINLFLYKPQLIINDPSLVRNDQSISLDVKLPLGANLSSGDHELDVPDAPGSSQLEPKGDTGLNGIPHISASSNGGPITCEVTTHLIQPNSGTLQDSLGLQQVERVKIKQPLDRLKCCSLV
ncbi:unnamed protein product [Protopolystoma xenopodis]|uniref:Uncharacterized protein n=1 Tax=Protopolystoma xenopodis TaxID=117903 RepID=A0A3S4ZHV0_9PLAT|nr:unnamed protein product [Protopolystoma xenopodis]